MAIIAIIAALAVSGGVIGVVVGGGSSPRPQIGRRETIPVAGTASPGITTHHGATAHLQRIETAYRPRYVIPPMTSEQERLSSALAAENKTELGAVNLRRVFCPVLSQQPLTLADSACSKEVIAAAGEAGGVVAGAVVLADAVVIVGGGTVVLAAAPGVLDAGALRRLRVVALLPLLVVCELPQEAPTSAIQAARMPSAIFLGRNRLCLKRGEYLLSSSNYASSTRVELQGLLDSPTHWDYTPKDTGRSAFAPFSGPATSAPQPEWERPRGPAFAMATVSNRPIAIVTPSRQGSPPA